MAEKPYSEWVEYSRRDLASAEYLQAMTPAPLEIICFHCQQAVEKALKAFLIYHGIQSVPRIHDLAELCKQCMKIEPRFSELLEPCADLTMYAVQTRYPTNVRIEEEQMLEVLPFAKEALSSIFGAMHDVDK